MYAKPLEPFLNQPTSPQPRGWHHICVSVKMKLIGAIAFISICGVLMSCTPVHSVTRYGIKATMIDAESKQPLARTETSIVVDGTAFERHSSNQGAISVRPDRQFHWSWLGGPAWMSDPEAVIEIEPHGYQPLRIKWQRYLPAQSSIVESRRFSEDGGVVNLGTLEMKKR